MSWRDAQALHIFSPNSQSTKNWIEQILGTVVKPLDDEFGEHIRWMWMTRYRHSCDTLPGSVIDHLKNLPLPSHFKQQGVCSYMLFRLSCEADYKAQIHNRALELAEAVELFAVPWVDYDVVGDLGNNRFIHEGATIEDRAKRAKLVANFIDATVRLMLHSLIEVDGQWQLEPNHNENNPDGSFFQSIHHLFCNATEVPLFVYINIQPSWFQGTAKYPVKF